ncbi:MAG TPA: hypothetical protein VK860_05050 [Ilumatobacteraceae bacterium]|nr:hypothetical protein [Ilumatobacteraceae bacterium]
MRGRAVAAVVLTALTAVFLAAGCGRAQENDEESREIAETEETVATVATAATVPPAATTTVVVCAAPPFGDVRSSPPPAMVELVGPWVDARPDLFAGVWWDGATGEFVFPAVVVEDAETRIAADLPDELAFRVERAPRNADDLEALQRRAGELSRFGIQPSTSRRVWDATVEIGLEILDEPSIDAVRTVFAGELDGICVTGADPADVPPPGPQPTAGEGWRLLADQAGRGEPYTVAMAVDEAGYDTLWTTLALAGEAPPVDFAGEIVVHFGAVYSGSCPEIRLDEVQIDAEAAIVAADIVQLGGNRICTSDANPRAYLVALDRSALPETPFTLLVDADCIDCGRLTVAASDLG